LNGKKDIMEDLQLSKGLLSVNSERTLDSLEEWSEFIRFSKNNGISLKEPVIGEKRILGNHTWEYTYIIKGESTLGWIGNKKMFYFGNWESLVEQQIAMYKHYGQLTNNLFYAASS
jgi:hypothetical protein